MLSDGGDIEDVHGPGPLLIEDEIVMGPSMCLPPWLGSGCCSVEIREHDECELTSNGTCRLPRTSVWHSSPHALADQTMASRRIRTPHAGTMPRSASI